MPRNILLYNKLCSFESAAEEESNFLLSIRHQYAAESLRHRLGSRSKPWSDTIVAYVEMTSARFYLRNRGYKAASIFTFSLRSIPAASPEG
ncbi:Uncharacterized protein TCAP_02767 [Tolypocladium capitatum]|uniref:Uncharacterized protein n=1 Tax=Tolypocladium capitatum TaxID=45235 RepID=A0A2K3QIE1_9HYPO|nr:Uncharacterized protein TCAP_02767 [Tolypocladium capitatum]